MVFQTKEQLREKVEEQIRIETEIHDMNKLVTVRCARCGRKINLLLCSYDETFAPICPVRCG
jgi:hypothetical protein